MKRAVKKRLVNLLALMMCVIMTGMTGLTAFAQGEPVANCTVGLNFEGRNAVLCGESVSGNVYILDGNGVDALNMSISYNSEAFTGVQVEANQGVTILASEEIENGVNLVVMIEPDKADYSKLLKVTATAGNEEATGSVSIVSVEGAMQGGVAATTIANDDNQFSIMTDAVIEEFNVQALSMAMTFFMKDNTYPEWPQAAKYDINQDGIINLKDFVKIANAILDAQRINQLKFNESGKFKIMQMSDIQDYIGPLKKNLNAKTVNLMNAALDSEKPDLVVITGDQIGANMNGEQLKTLITQIAQPFETRKIPWMVTFGNHDEDATTALNEGWNKIQQLAFYRSFQYNVNRASMSGNQGYMANGKNTIGVGDMYQLIYDQSGKVPLYNVWALDSNRYEDSGKGIGGYDWIRPGQIQWYSNTSAMLEAKYGNKVNSLMFFHIPTPEWGTMWANKEEFNVVGEKNEAECPANINSGLYTAALARGDVKGMFVGHDHVNSYTGNFYGIQLGYDANVGYQTYGIGGDQNDRLRGVRTFELDQNNLETFSTKMVLASDLGVNQ